LKILAERLLQGFGVVVATHQKYKSLLYMVCYTWNISYTIYGLVLGQFRAKPAQTAFTFIVLCFGEKRDTKDSSNEKKKVNIYVLEAGMI
jgi:hypothetical protein